MHQTEAELTSDDYLLAARYSDAQQTLAAIEERLSQIKLEAQRKAERLRTAHEQAKARVARLTPAYQAMQARYRHD